MTDSLASAWQNCRDYAAQCARKDVDTVEYFVRVLAATPRTDAKWLPSLRYALRYLLIADRLQGLDTERAARCRELGLTGRVAFPAVTHFKARLRQATDAVQEMMQ